MECAPAIERASTRARTEQRAPVIARALSASSNFDRKFIDLAQVEDRFNEVIEGISTGIQTGLFPANPGPQGLFGPENCSYCDFARICPSAKSGLWDRKKDDVRLASYIGLSGPSAEQEDEL